MSTYFSTKALFEGGPNSELVKALAALKETPSCCATHLHIVIVDKKKDDDHSSNLSDDERKGRKPTKASNCHFSLSFRPGGQGMPAKGLSFCFWHAMQHVACGHAPCRHACLSVEIGMLSRVTEGRSDGCIFVAVTFAPNTRCQRFASLFMGKISFLRHPTVTRRTQYSFRRLPFFFLPCLCRT